MTTVSTALPPAEPYRLLGGWFRGERTDFAAHLARYGPVPDVAGLIEVVERAGLRGRGGAWYPTANKLRAVTAGRRTPVIVANGCDGEPFSDKDVALLSVSCHLVLDGIQLAAAAIGAREAIVCLHEDSPVEGTVRAAIIERRNEPCAVRVESVPRRYVASEESALVNFLNAGDARPTTKPPRPTERGVRPSSQRRPAPTLVDNVETLAQLALIARYGPAWFRRYGTETAPGTTLLTTGGAVNRYGVYEVPLGTPVGRAIELAGGPYGHIQAALVGGCGGTWLPLPIAAATPLTPANAAGAQMGIAALTVLESAACGLAETSGILRYLADESAAQCGPCMFGLPAIAEDFAVLTEGGPDAAPTLKRLRHRLGLISGRGACGHPDAAVRLARSALATFRGDLARHLSGAPCPGSTTTTLRPGSAR